MKKDFDHLVDAGSEHATLCLVGHADYLNCAPLGKFLDFTVGSTRYAVITLDFSRCTSIDSTVLGLIARAAINLRRNPDRRILLVNLRDGPRRAALQLGLGHLAGIEDSAEIARRFTPPPFPTAQPDPIQGVNAETIRDAHEALMEIDPGNRDVFADVMSFISTSRRLNRLAPTPSADPA